MSDSAEQMPVSLQERIDRIADRFEADFKADKNPRIEDYIQAEPDLDPHLLKELLQLELELLRKRAEKPQWEAYRERFPNHATIIDEAFGLGRTELDRTKPEISEEADESMPDQIGRYEVIKRLGQGGFGVVYLAHDPKLDRSVAIKLPRRERFETSEQIESFIREARIAANLKHAGLVAVYDVDELDGLPFIVQEFIDGPNLAKWAREHEPRFHEMVRILASISEALGYAHQKGLTHCDLKLANVLMDASGEPHVADFGLAVHEKNQALWEGKRFGTPDMMAPEQVRGEGHRLDGRTDIWAVGVMMYELLVQRRPFSNADKQKLFDDIKHHDPKTPTMIDRSVPKELERICLKCLSKRARDRYNSADQLREDLLAWLDQADSTARPNSSTVASTPDSDPPSSTPSSETTQQLRVVPKGLRSFDAEDADFFLDLLPGPRDRDGLPDSVRFWKGRIEETDPDNTFAVGLIYGPSGCGKSSMVKAGLIPLLGDHVLPIYVEATGEDTEVRILKQIRKHVVRLETIQDLQQCFADLRIRGGGRNRKVLIIIDQFEQWLHANKNREGTQLAQALRQADGEHLQCILMVRDDFWSGIKRFFDELEFAMIDGDNEAIFDLFSERHARNVLAAFGRAFGALPQEDADMTAEHTEFLKQAVADLAEEGKVVSVRLALFADMMKHKPWTPASLEEVGGTEGVGEMFLEETFSSRSASPEHRFHQEAARRVLASLLPDLSTDIKGRMRSRDELLDASGYQDRPREFSDLIRILDSELRLITPTEPDGGDANDKVKENKKHYQLTHDYLVRSLRKWLTRKQQETRKGRAELKLAERSALWNAKREDRHLPSLWEWASIRMLTEKQEWTEPQRTMMAKAGRSLGVRWGTALAVLLAVGIAVQQYVAVVQHDSLIERVRTTVAAMRTSRGTLVPRAIRDLRELSSDDLVVEELMVRLDNSKPSEKLSLAYALADYGEGDSKYLLSAIADAPAAECANFVTALRHGDEEDTLQRLEDLKNEADQNSDWQLKGRLAVLALYLGDSTIAADIHRDRPDPTQQTVFIHEVFPTWHADLKELANVINDANDAPLRAGMCLAMGNLAVDELGDAKQTWQDLLIRWYSQSPDSATHSAARWALRQWNVEDFPKIEPDAVEPLDRQWKVTAMGRKQGFTMVRIPKGAFERTEGKIKQTVALTGDLWLSDVEVTVGLFQQFIDDEEYPGQKPENWKGADTSISPSDQHPVQQVSWEDAVLFCNWLSWKEGAKPCYKIAPITNGTWSPLEPTLSVTLLSGGTGYRLPTEAEWEYACRARTTTDFGFGQDAERLKQYAVFSSTRTEQVGSRMCNRWGVFDIHGNVVEWCYDWYGDYIGAEVENPTGPEKGSYRVVRGGSWYYDAGICQSGPRVRGDPRARINYYGFRVAQVPLPDKTGSSGAESESRSHDQAEGGARSGR